MAAPALTLLVFIAAHECVIDAVAARISPELERELGAATLARIKATTRLVDDGPQYAAVDTIGQRLAPVGPYHYRFHLGADDTINAFALPGGDIVVNRGLLAASTRPEELAGVLAHEIQHVELRHSLKGRLRDTGVALLWTVLVGDPRASLVGELSTRLLTLKFSRDAESAADAGGFALLLTRGIDPAGMVDFFRRLAQSGGATPPALLSSHPPSTEREAALAALLSAVDQHCCQPLDRNTSWPPRD